MEALRRVSYWDDLEKERKLGLEEHEGRTKAKDYFRSWALMEEISRRQKSKETWLKEGDKNTRFFHRMTNAHRRRNFLQSLSINGRRLDKEVEIKEVLVNAFQNMFYALDCWRPPLPGLSFNVIRPEEPSKLEEVFTEKEIWAAISKLNGDKAPGPNGFPIAFWSFCWDFVKNEVLGFFKEFHDQSRFVKA